MKNERCLPDQHKWVCRQSTGTLGELVSERLLTPEEITEVQVEPGKAEKVCPHGVIVCSQCRANLGQQSEETTINFRQLLDKLTDQS